MDVSRVLAFSPDGMLAAALPVARKRRSRWLIFDLEDLRTSCLALAPELVSRRR